MASTLLVRHAAQPHSSSTPAPSALDAGAHLHLHSKSKPQNLERFTEEQRRARVYLLDHELDVFMSSMLNHVLTLQPPDPKLAFLKYIAERCDVDVLRTNGIFVEDETEGCFRDPRLMVGREARKRACTEPYANSFWERVISPVLVAADKDNNPSAGGASSSSKTLESVYDDAMASAEGDHSTPKVIWLLCAILEGCGPAASSTGPGGESNINKDGKETGNVVSKEKSVFSEYGVERSSVSSSKELHNFVHHQTTITSEADAPAAVLGGKQHDRDPPATAFAEDKTQGQMSLAKQKSLYLHWQEVVAFRVELIAESRDASNARALSTWRDDSGKTVPMLLAMLGLKFGAFPQLGVGDFFAPNFSVKDLVSQVATALKSGSSSSAAAATPALVSPFSTRIGVGAKAVRYLVEKQEGIASVQDFDGRVLRDYLVRLDDILSNVFAEKVEGGGLSKSEGGAGLGVPGADKDNIRAGARALKDGIGMVPEAEGEERTREDDDGEDF